MTRFSGNSVFYRTLNKELFCFLNFKFPTVVSNFILTLPQTILSWGVLFCTALLATCLSSCLPHETSFTLRWFQLRKLTSSNTFVIMTLLGSPRTYPNSPSGTSEEAHELCQPSQQNPEGSDRTEEVGYRHFGTAGQDPRALLGAGKDHQCQQSRDQIPSHQCGMAECSQVCLQVDMCSLCQCGGSQTFLGSPNVSHGLPKPI